MQIDIITGLFVVIRPYNTQEWMEDSLYVMVYLHQKYNARLAYNLPYPDIGHGNFNDECDCVESIGTLRGQSLWMPLQQ